MIEAAILHSDGGSRGNPGPAAIGAVLKTPEGHVLGCVSRTLGVTTNNQAEYQALYAGLLLAQEKGVRRLACFLDSELVVKQLKREYRLKEKTLQPWFVRIWNLLPVFEQVSFTAIPRSQNKEADRLVNQALDRG